MARDRPPHEDMSELYSEKNIELVLRTIASSFWFEEQDEALNMRTKLRSIKS